MPCALRLAVGGALLELEFEQGGDAMRTYVLQVVTGREHKTVAELEHLLGDRLRGKLFVPRYRFKKRIKGTWEMTEQLLTPGYVFIESSMTDIEDIARVIREAPAFARVLAQNGRIVPLSADETQWLDKLTGTSRVVDPSVGFIEGDRVVITQGPLVGLESQIVKIDRHKQLAYIEVRLLGRVKVVKVGVEIVRKT
ncbi:antiterminator LoaP [Collinsella tanakaei]|uniref:antiterminator LoaP n=1 Tax=Collinsella tanakaei TaxID=626935 RepID=UPI001EF4751B|nr:antiterminator LoaP [Collinsella tanakaei]